VVRCFVFRYANPKKEDEMNATNLRAALERIAPKLPVWVWGPPGVGKSCIVYDWAETVGEFRDLRACLLESVDLRGLPYISNGAAVWLPPEFLPRKGKGVLFLDELAQAPIPVQNACLQLALDRRIGEYRLPDGWVVVAASNRVEDRAGANRVTTALLGRFCHLDLEVSTDDWLAWAANSGISPEVRAFIAWRPALLHAFDPSKRSSPNPRGYEFVSRVLSEIPSTECEFPVVSGILGDAVAGEFLGFRRTFSQLPSIDPLLADPANHPVPSEPSTKHALIGCLVDRIKGGDKKVREAIATVFGRLGAEFATCGFKQAVQIDRSFATGVAAARDWFTKNRSLIVS
jgi:hypothetical protein